MTTKVTVDAHAGWPVEVVFEDIFYAEGKPTGETKPTTEIVEANSIRDFYIHSARHIVSIKEMERTS